VKLERRSRRARPVLHYSRTQTFVKRDVPLARQKFDSTVIRTHVRQAHPERTNIAAPQFVRPVASARKIARSEVSLSDRDISATRLPSPSWSGFQSDPYVDYGRFLTAEGGILFIYKDLDLRLRHLLWRLFACTASTGGEGWYLYYHSPVDSIWINVLCVLAIGVLNWFIVSKPVEVYRRVEIRPDCMILDGADVFWLRHMEGGWPTFHTDEEDNQLLCGIYGTRFVEFLTIRRFDPLDRMVEIVSAHLQDAMKQLWERPNFGESVTTEASVADPLFPAAAQSAPGFPRHPYVRAGSPPPAARLRT
jgi:hypothetical protein